MVHRGLGLMVAAAAVVMCSAAEGQVRSHHLGAAKPKVLVPAWVMKTPPYYVREVTPVPPADEEWGPGGPPSAARNMPPEARRVVESAQAGRWAEAAQAGQAFLRKPLTEADDYTWDYVGNATAWALLELDRPAEAAQAHQATADRLRDLDMRTAHRLIAVAIQKAARAGRALKQADAYRRAVRAELAPRIAQCRNYAKAARATDVDSAVLYRLQRTWGELRVIAAADPDLGQELTRSELIPAADTLVTKAIPRLMKEARATAAALKTDFENPLPHRITGQWNARLQALWDKVAQIKRDCYIHTYLAERGFASPGRAEPLFRQAHRLLFATGNLVWQPIGLARIVNDIPQKDLRRRVPWQETKIAPLDAALAIFTNESESGWRKPEKMTSDGFRKMDGGGFRKMGGGGWQKMGDQGWQKMNSGGWTRPGAASR